MNIWIITSIFSALILANTVLYCRNMRPDKTDIMGSSMLFDGIWFAASIPVIVYITIHYKIPFWWYFLLVPGAMVSGLVYKFTIAELCVRIFMRRDG